MLVWVAVVYQNTVPGILIEESENTGYPRLAQAMSQALEVYFLGPVILNSERQNKRLVSMLIADIELSILIGVRNSATVRICRPWLLPSVRPQFPN